jgi:hypothetical protein
MEESEYMPSVRFIHTNEFGQTFDLSLDLDFSENISNPFDEMICAFAKFMVACGYSAELVKKEIYEDI